VGQAGILAWQDRVVVIHQPALIKRILFIKDDPLAFFGQTANLHKPMRRLVTYIFAKHDLYLAGLEKSGPFVDHVAEISKRLAEMPGGRVAARGDS
jgi:hypothetical protein